MMLQNLKRKPEMIKQNNPECLQIIQKIGCFVRSCGAIAELKEMKQFTANQINELWLWAKKSGNIDHNDDVKHSAPIATHALRMLGNETGRFVEVATFKNGRMNYYASIPDSWKTLPKSYIQKVKTDGQIGTHFRVINCEGGLLFDPYEPEVKVQDLFYSIVYAYKENW